MEATTCHVILERWIDGDSFKATYRTASDVVLPWCPKEQILNVHHVHVTVRCLGLSCPETRGGSKAAGIAAKVFAESLIPPGSLVSIQEIGQEKYGRCLGRVMFGPEYQRDFAAEMIAKGHDDGRKYKACMEGEE
jgi:endonuclease YncB( thermonuclease family)